MKSIFTVPTGKQSKVKYEQYKGLKAQIDLLHVDWDRDYSNLVAFDTPAELASFIDTHKQAMVFQDVSPVLKALEEFDKQTGRFNGLIRLETPLNVVNSINYFRIRLPRLPIPYSGITPSRQEYFFFANGYSQLAPNTVEFNVELDVWTTNQFELTIPWVELLEGHYPCGKTSVDEYLANPIEKTEWIKTPEPDISISDTKRPHKGKFINWNSGENKLIAFSAIDLEKTNTGTVANYQTEIAELAADNGFLNWGWATRSTAKTPPPTFSAQGTTANIGLNGWSGAYAYAVDADKAAEFHAALTAKELAAIQGIFVLPANFIDETNPRNWRGIRMATPATQPKLFEFDQFTKGDFGYSAPASEFAKTYTAPFTHIRVSTLDKEVYVNLEEISRLGAEIRLFTQFPVIKAEAFLTGIGEAKSGDIEYVFFNANGENAGRIEDSMWSKYPFDVEIPAIALFSKPTALAIAKQSAKAIPERQIAEYQKQLGIQKADSEYRSSTEIAVANFDAINADINTIYGNDIRAINAARNAAINTANTDLNNANLTADMVKANADNAANTAKAVGLADAATNRSIARQNADLTRDNTRDDLAQSLKFKQLEKTAQTSIEAARNTKTILDANTNSTLSILNNTFMGTWATAASGTDATGALSLAKDVLTIAAAEALTAYEVAHIGHLRDNNLNFQQASLNAANAEIDGQISEENVRQNAKITREFTANYQIADKEFTQKTEDANAINAMELVNNTLENATNKQTAANAAGTEIGNANSIASAASANAADQRDTGLANNDLRTKALRDGYDSEAKREKADAIMRRAAIEAKYAAEIAEAGFVSPSIQGYSSQDIGHSSQYATQTGLNGLLIQPVRCDKAAERLIASKFCQKGYTLGQTVRLSRPKDLHCMRYFTYWKARDLLVLGENTTEIIQETIREAFKRGVRVWRNNDDIASIDPMENLPE